MTTFAPGTLKEREQAAVLLFARSMEWLYQHPDENLRGFQAWISTLSSSAADDMRPALEYDADVLGLLFWKCYENIQ